VIAALGPRWLKGHLPLDSSCFSRRLAHESAETLFAARAFAQIGCRGSDRALAGARPGFGRGRRHAGQRITCADKLIDSGQKAEALAIYARLDQAKLPQLMRVAIAQGKLRAAGAKR